MRRFLDHKVIGVVKSVVIAQVVAIILLLGMTALMALLISNETIGQEAYSYCVWGALAVSVIGGSVVAEFGDRDRAMINSILFAAVYILLLLCSNALFFDGTYNGVGVSTLLVMGISIAVGLIAFIRKRQSGNHRFRYRKGAIV